jgi:RNA polymerase sigma factor (sigma-70 family)
MADRTRRGQRFVSLGDINVTGQNASDDLALDSFALALDREQLRRALLSLPCQHRDLLVLRFYDDLDTDELCAVLGCSNEDLAVRLHRALRALRIAIASESSDVS